MNVFEEFKRLVLELEKKGVGYAVVGGVAMAFYTEPRFTRDIDLLVDSNDLDKVKDIWRKKDISNPHRLGYSGTWPSSFAGF